MPDKTIIMRDLQMAVRREMDRRSIALKVVALDSGLGLSAVTSYFPKPGGKRLPAVIPMSVVWLFVDTKALPLDLLSLLLPDGISLIETGEVDHHEAAAQMQDFLTTKAAYHRPESEDGCDLGPNECADLDERRARMRA